MSPLFTKIVISVVILQDAVMQKNDDRILGIEITIEFRSVSPKAAGFVFFSNRVT